MTQTSVLTAIEVMKKKITRPLFGCALKTPVAPNVITTIVAMISSSAEIILPDENNLFFIIKYTRILTINNEHTKKQIFVIEEEKPKIKPSINDPELKINNIEDKINIER